MTEKELDEEMKYAWGEVLKISVNPERLKEIMRTKYPDWKVFRSHQDVPGE